MASLTNFEKLLYATVKISVETATGSASGTGFFYQVAYDDTSHIPLLVTNKHVLRGANKISIWLHVRSAEDPTQPSGEVNQAILHINHGEIINHPDPDVDLCAIAIAPLLDGARNAGKPTLFIPLMREIIPTDEQWEDFDALEQVVMIGCPNGIYDKTNHHPIMRQGITASPLGKRYGGKPEFMVDMACFPGSSGSPVVLSNQLGHIDKKTGNFNMGLGRFFFVGILYSGPLINNKGEIVLNKLPSVNTNTMMHLGNVIRASELYAIEDIVKKLAAKSAPPA